MLGRYSVKKPYTVVVGVILVIILGVISFMNMTTDLLPSMNFPYVIVYTTYIGATPEQVEDEVTRPMESAFATLTDVKNISSTSSDNLALVVLEFNDTADMNTALIEINSEITTLSATWNDSIGAPAIMKINPDMLPVSIVSVSRDGMDILELSEYVENELIPEFESINGVASVSASGLISEEVDVTIEQDRIDILNNAILREVDEELADVEQQLNDAQAQISDGKSQLARAKRTTMAQINDAAAQLEGGEAQLAAAISELTAQRNELAAQLDQVNAALEQMEGLVNMTDEQKALLQSLEDQMANLRTQKKNLEDQLAALENGTGNETLNAQRAEAVAKRDELNAEKARLQAYIDDLQQGDTEKLAAEIEALNGQIAAAQSELDAAQSDLTAKTDARDATQAHINELKDEIAALEGSNPTDAPTDAPENTIAPTDAPTTAPENTDSPTDAPTTAPENTDSPTDAPTVTPESTDMPIVTDQPIDPTDAPVDPTDTPVDPTDALVDPTDAPVDPTDTPVEPTDAPVDPTDAPVDPTDAPVDPTDAPVDPTDAPVDPTDAPAQPTVPPEQPLPDAETLFASLFSALADNAALDELKAELSAAETSLAQLNESVAAAQSVVDEKQAAVSSLTAQRDAKQSTLDDLDSGATESRIQAARSEITKLDLRIAAVNLEISGIDELLKNDTAAADTLRDSIALLDQAITAIENSEEYKALQMILDQDELNAQYAAAQQGKAQLEAGIAQIDSVLSKLNQGIIPGGMIEGIDQDTSLADARAQLESGRSQAVSGFAEAEAQLNAASAELAAARKEFEEGRDEALKNAGLDGIITLETVAGLIGAQNLSMPAGYVYDVSEDQYLVRVGDKFASLDELKNLKLFSIGMESVDDVRLCDVARVEIVDNRAEAFTKVDGQDGILLSIEKQSTFSTSEVSGLVGEKSAELIAEIDGLHIVDMFNQGDYINLIVDSVLSNLISGGALAVLILLIFLLDWRPTLIVACSIPLSVVAAFVCMYFSDMTLNVLSLSGLALGIGMLVDNSIVAIENIYRLYYEEKKPLLRSCIEGVNSIGGALFSSTLTTICVFLPVLFVSGMAHDLFMDIGLTIAFSLLASLVVAMTLVPSMAAALLKRRKKAHKNLFAPVQRGYVWLLKGALKAKVLVLLVSVALLVVTVMQVPNMGVSFMPQVNSTQMTASLAIDPEAELGPQQDKAVQLMNLMTQIDGIETVGLSGSSGTMALMGGGGDLTYYIIVDENSGRENADIAGDIQSAADSLGMDLGIQTSTMDISMMTGSGISVNITGPEIDQLRAVASDLAAIIAEIPGTTDIDDGMEDSVPEMRITVDKEKATDNNLTVGQVLQFVATKLAGKTEITQATLDGKTLSIYVVDGRNADITPDMLEDLEIKVTTAEESEMVRIGDIASVEQTQSFSSINRSSQQRVLTVSFQIADGYSMNHVSDQLEEKLGAYQVPDGYTVALAGENETVMAIMEDLVFMVVIAIVLIFLIMVAQFQSFKSPIIVMFTIPLAFTGGLAALLLTGMDLSIVAMVGFLVLSGVIVNNGIVFVDSVNQLRITGLSKREALLETGRLRLRPILMTAATTILGMSTMALATGMGAEMMQPMAVVTIGGLTYATLMTLFVVPVLYDMVNGEKMKAREIEMAREAAGLANEDIETREDPAPEIEPPKDPDDDPKPPKRGRHAEKPAEEPAPAAEPVEEPVPAPAPVEAPAVQPAPAPVEEPAAKPVAAPVKEPAARQVVEQPAPAATAAAQPAPIPPQAQPAQYAQPQYAPYPQPGMAPQYAPYPQPGMAPQYAPYPQYMPPQGYPSQPYGYAPQAPYGYMPPQYAPYPQGYAQPQGYVPQPQDAAVQPNPQGYPQGYAVPPQGYPQPYPYGYPPQPPAESK